MSKDERYPHHANPYESPREGEPAESIPGPLELTYEVQLDDILEFYSQSNHFLIWAAFVIAWLFSIPTFRYMEIFDNDFRLQFAALCIIFAFLIPLVIYFRSSFQELHLSVLKAVVRPRDFETMTGKFTVIIDDHSITEVGSTSRYSFRADEVLGLSVSYNMLQILVVAPQENWKSMARTAVMTIPIRAFKHSGELDSFIAKVERVSGKKAHYRKQ